MTHGCEKDHGLIVDRVKVEKFIDSRDHDHEEFHGLTIIISRAFDAIHDRRGFHGLAMDGSVSHLF